MKKVKKINSNDFHRVKLLFRMLIEKFDQANRKIEEMIEEIEEATKLALQKLEESK
jgi:acetyl-CoA carboxylase alpha subunit